MTELLGQYGCGPIQFTGTTMRFTGRIFCLTTWSTSQRGAHGSATRLRPLGAGRPLATMAAHRANIRTREPQAHLLPLDGVPYRALAANNIVNLLLDPVAKRLMDEKGVDTLAFEQEPDAGLGNGGLGRLAACFIDSMATMQLPAMGYGLRYEYGIFRQAIENGWQREQPDNWLRRTDPWEVARPQEQVEVKLGCSFEVRGGTLRVVAGRPSSLIGMPFDRPVVGYGGKTINTLRLWAAATADLLRLSVVQRRRIRRCAGRAAIGGIPDAGALSGQFHEYGPRPSFRAGVFPGRLLAARLVRRFRAATPIGARFPTRSPSSSTTRIPVWPSPN